VGSFEVMGACKQHAHQHGLRLAMLMYPDNAQRITAVLNPSRCPKCGPT
jgi:Mn-dependent DtxR family transcriptional regulator